MMVLVQPQQRERIGDRHRRRCRITIARSIVGETTFGKALVQSVYTISEKAGLALTTGRYFTPSGRMIQRPWDGAFDEYLTYTLRDQKPEREHSSTQLKYTDAGRKVYSGGGIEPDKFFAGPVQGFNPTRFGRVAQRAVGVRQLRRALRGGRGHADGRGRRRQEAARARVRRHRRDGRGLQAFLQSEKVKIDDAAFAKDVDYIKAMIHFEIDVALFGIAEGQKNLIAHDPQAQFALAQFADAVKLTELARTKATSKGGH